MKCRETHTRFFGKKIYYNLLENLLYISEIYYKTNILFFLKNGLEVLIFFSMFSHDVHPPNTPLSMSEDNGEEMMHDDDDMFKSVDDETFTDEFDFGELSFRNFFFK